MRTQSGAEINGTSIIEIRGAQVEASRNGGFGVGAGSNSQLAVFGFDVSRGNTFTADANGQGGILLGDSLLNVFTESTIAITNSPLGIQVGARHNRHHSWGWFVRYRKQRRRPQLCF